MTFVVVVTERAARDMEKTADWWAREHSAEQAERWYAGIRHTLTTLAEFPERCAVAPEQPDFAYPLRELHYGLGRRPTHRAVFTIVKNTVVVLTIRHATQDRLHPNDI